MFNPPTPGRRTRVCRKKKASHSPWSPLLRGSPWIDNLSVNEADLSSDSFLRAASGTDHPPPPGICLLPHRDLSTTLGLLAEMSPRKLSNFLFKAAISRSKTPNILSGFWRFCLGRVENVNFCPPGGVIPLEGGQTPPLI